MDYIGPRQFDANALAEDIIKHYGKFNVKIDIIEGGFLNGRFIFRVKTKGSTREKHLYTYAADVQFKLELPTFFVVKENFALFVIASRNKLKYSHLPTILNSPDAKRLFKKMSLPYVIGHNVLGMTVVQDLAEFPHLLLGGSTGSGKSVGLQALITSIAHAKSPSEVNFVLIDTGCTNLLAFESLPHLSHPVVQDHATALRVLTALTREMELRIKMVNSPALKLLGTARLVVVIDEFLSLFQNIEKAEKQALAANISALLQRGRHAKIHMILAAQNPTFQNMQVDLGNITTRIAFACAKGNNSETILDESGAENLSGQGELLLKSQNHGSLQRIQGAYITPDELQQTVLCINARYSGSNYERYKFSLSDEDLMEPSGDLSNGLKCIVVRNCPSDADRLLSKAILWALAHDNVSINALKNEHHLGWNTAAALFQRLTELGIVAPANKTLPREVIPKVLEDLPIELLEFLGRCSHSRESVISAFQQRNAVSKRPQILDEIP